jgi:hypothetical protein
MKIRNGFVSNSSSSSFIITGINFSVHSDDLDDKFRHDLEECEDEMWEVFDKYGIEYVGDEDGEYIGIATNFTDETRTIKQLKEEAFNKLKKVFKKLDYSQIDFFYGSTYNG